MFCRQCGRQIEKVKFCPYCGADLRPAAEKQPADQPAGYQQPEGYQQAAYQQPDYQDAAYQQAPEKKKGKAVWIIVPVAVVAVLAAAAVILIPRILSPTGKFGAALQKSVDAFSGSDLYKTVDHVLNGTTTAEYDISQQLDAEDGPNIVKVTMVSDLDGGKIQTSGEMISKGSSVMDLNVYLTDSVIVESEVVFGDGAYGIRMSELDKNLPGSVFDPGSKSQYALTEEQYESLMKVERSPSEALRDLLNSSVWLLKQAPAEFMTLAAKEGEVETESASYEAGGVSIDCTRTVITCEGEAVRSLMEGYLDWLENGSAKEQLTKMADSYRDLMVYSLLSGKVSAEYAGIDSDEFFRRLTDSRDDMEDDDMEDTSLNISYYVAKKTKQLVAVEFTSIGSEGKESTVSFAMGPDWKDPDMITIRNDDQVFIFKVTENTSSVYEATMTSEEDGDAKEAVFRWDRGSGEFELTSSGEKATAVTGTLSVKGDTTRIEVEEQNALVTIEKGGKVSGGPDFTEFLNMSEDEVTELFSDAQEGVQALQ